MPARPREWAHGSVYGYRSAKCRCEPCTLAHRAHMREYQARLNVLTGRTTGKRPHIKDVSSATPMQSCGCSLAGIDPPWMWTWDRAFSFTPFTAMRQIPTSAEYGGSGDAEWIDNMSHRPMKRRDPT
jgi:hypothetical protein